MTRATTARPLAERIAASTQQVGGPVYFAYDENGNRTMMQSPTGTVYWTYDELDRMVSEEEI